MKGHSYPSLTILLFFISSLMQVITFSAAALGSRGLVLLFIIVYALLQLLVVITIIRPVKAGWYLLLATFLPELFIGLKYLYFGLSDGVLFSFFSVPYLIGYSVIVWFFYLAISEKKYYFHHNVAFDIRKVPTVPWVLYGVKVFLKKKILSLLLYTSIFIILIFCLIIFSLITQPWERAPDILSYYIRYVLVGAPLMFFLIYMGHQIIALIFMKHSHDILTPIISLGIRLGGFLLALLILVIIEAISLNTFCLGLSCSIERNVLIKAIKVK